MSGVVPFHNFLKVSLLCAILFPGTAPAFLVMPSLNTYETSNVTDALDRVDELHGDGVWFITRNCNFTDGQFEDAFFTLGGRQVTEDNPGSSKSYDDYVRIMGAAPLDSFCYNETGGEPGGTLLTDEQIDQQYASHGNNPIIVLTRAYMGDWKTEVDRCLANPKVAGVCMEYVKEALLETTPGIHNAAPDCIKAILAAGKKCYILLHASADGWSDAENARIINKLNGWAPSEMATDDAILVYQNYVLPSEDVSADKTSEWLANTESVKSAIRQAKTMSNYTGNQVSYSFGHTDEGWRKSSSIEASAYTARGEFLLRAAPNSDPFIYRTGLSIDSSKVNLIRVRVCAQVAGNMQLFWGTESNNSFAAVRSVTASYPVANQWKEFLFDLSDHPDWIGHTITRLRFDTTAGASPQHTWVDYILGSGGYSFDFTSSREGWGGLGIASGAEGITAQGEYFIRVDPGYLDPKFVRSDLYFDGGVYRKVMVRYKSGKGGNVQLFWGIEGNSGFSPSRVKTVYVAPDEWVNIEFDMSDQPSWVGKNIVSLRLDPPGVSSSETAKYTYLDWLDTGF